MKLSQHDICVATKLGIYIFMIKLLHFIITPIMLLLKHN